MSQELDYTDEQRKKIKDSQREFSASLVETLKTAGNVVEEGLLEESDVDLKEAIQLSVWAGAQSTLESVCRDYMLIPAEENLTVVPATVESWNETNRDHVFETGLDIAPGLADMFDDISS